MKDNPKNIYARYGCVAIIVFWAVCWMAAFSLTGNCSSISSIFDQNNRTYRWDSSLEYLYTPSSQLSFFLDGKLQSTLIKRSLITGRANQWQEDRSGRGKLFYNITPRLGLNMEFFQGYNSLGNRRLNDSEVIGGVSYSPRQWILLDYGMGGMISLRTEPMGKRIDHGAKMSWNGQFSPRILGASEFRVKLGVLQEIYRTIPANEFSIASEYRKAFVSGDSIHIHYLGLRGQRDYYVSSYSMTGTNTQKKYEHALDGRLFKHLPLDMGLLIEADVGFKEYLYEDKDTAAEFINPKNRDNSRLSQELFLRLNRSMAIGPRNLEMLIAFRHNEFEEDFGQNDRDENSAYGEFGGGFNFPFTDRDTLVMDFSTAVRSFYHPGEYARQGDRDVQSQVANIIYSRGWSRYLASSVRFGYRDFHQIYIYEEKSADNNRNYTYLLAPELKWFLSERSIIGQRFEIQANYITYDYEKELLKSRNRIFRRGDSRSNISYIFSRRLTARMEYGYRYEDYGQLVFSDQWQQLKSWDRRGHIGFAGFDYYPMTQLRITPSYSFEFKREWDHSEMAQVIASDTNYIKLRKLVDRQDQRMITLELEYDFAQDERLIFTAGRRLINGWRRGHIRDENFTISIRRMF